MIELKDVRKSFGKNEVLKGINLTIKEGDVVAVIGSSGSGKSTMLRTINHLETIDSGQILIDGKVMGGSAKQIYEARLELGMVFQQFNLFANKSVKENIMFAPVKIGISNYKKTKRKNRIIALSNIFTKEKKAPLPLPDAPAEVRA